MKITELMIFTKEGKGIAKIPVKFKGQTSYIQRLEDKIPKETRDN